MTNAIELHPLYAAEYWRLVAFFEFDSTIEVGEINDKTKSCTITCDDALKAKYLQRLLKLEELHVDIESPEEPEEICEDMVDYVCKDNMYYSYMHTSDTMAGFPAKKALMFSPECVSVFTDDAFSPNGHSAYLAQDLAKEIFNGNLNYQTDFDDEW